MNNGLEIIKNITKKIIKKVTQKLLTVILPIILLILLVAIILGGFIKVLTEQDAIYEEGSWDNTPYAASFYTSNITIDENGNINSNMSAQEIWDKLLENDSRVTEYLDSPEELLKLMNAEVITNFPDTRPNPNEPIDWDSLNKDINAKNVQGIIKFKRAKSDGTSTTITFVDNETYYEWIEAYNVNGDKNALENILNHFTMEEEFSIQNNFSPDDITADISNAIVQASYSTPTKGAGLCQAWVRQVYANAGLGNIGYATAYEAFKANVVSTDMNNIPIGAAVYGTGKNSRRMSDMLEFILVIIK